MLFNHNATEITVEEFYNMLNSWVIDKTSAPYSTFWLLNDDMYTVVDNESGDFFVESFKTPEAASAWLRCIDTDICYKIDEMLA